MRNTKISEMREKEREKERERERERGGLDFLEFTCKL